MPSPWHPRAPRSARPLPRSLPLDRAGWLRGDVVRDPIHALHLVDDPRRQPLEELVGQTRPTSCHRVLARDRTDDDRIAVRTLVAHHPDGADRRQNREVLPDRPVEAGLFDLVEDDRVRLAKRVGALLGDLADDADTEAWTWEGLTPNHLGRQAELFADRPHLVLEELAERLDELEFHVVGEAADVVVGLDRRRVAGPGLDDV